MLCKVGGLGRETDGLLCKAGGFGIETDSLLCKARGLGMKTDVFIKFVAQNELYLIKINGGCDGVEIVNVVNRNHVVTKLA